MSEPRDCAIAAMAKSRPQDWKQLVQRSSETALNMDKQRARECHESELSRTFDPLRQVAADVPSPSGKQQQKSMPRPAVQPDRITRRDKRPDRKGKKKVTGAEDGDGSSSDSEAGDGKREPPSSSEEMAQKRAALGRPQSLTDALGGHAADARPSIPAPVATRAEPSRWSLAERARRRARAKPYRAQLARDARQTYLGKPRSFESDLAHWVRISRIKEQQDFLQEFLDRSLYHAIIDEDQFKQEEDAWEESRKQVLCDAETTAAKHLKHILEQNFAVQCKDCNIEELGDRRKGTFIVSEYLHSSSHSNLTTVFRLPFEVDVVQAIKKNANDEEIVKTLQELRGGQARADELFKDVLSWKWPDGQEAFNPLTATCLQIVVGGLNEEERPEAAQLHASDILFNSRFPDRLKSRYMKWIVDRCGQHTFDQLVDRHYQRSCLERHTRILREFRTRMSEARIPWSQEFWPEAVAGQWGKDGSGGGADLGFFRDGLLRKKLTATRKELKQMGWRDDAPWMSPSARYWRYAVYDDQPDWIFVVDMDEQIIGLEGPE